MTVRTRSWHCVFAGLLAISMLGCSDSTGNPAAPGDSTGTGGGSTGGGPTGGGSTGGSGRLTIKITDSPFSEAEAVLVTFDEVSVHRAEHGWETLDFASGNERTCDLKNLEGPTDILGVSNLPAGHYTQIRLRISEAWLDFDTATTQICGPKLLPLGDDVAALDIPSGEVKLNRQFELEAGNDMQITLDFDGDKSIHETGSPKGGPNAGQRGRYMMKPVISVISVE